VKQNRLNFIAEHKSIQSAHLKRNVLLDIFIPKKIIDNSWPSLLLINDGQNLQEMGFHGIIDKLAESNQIEPVFYVGIHAGKDRKHEYGTADVLDYEGRGSKAKAYNNFILKELLPFIHIHYGIEEFQKMAIAGFSLGGLSALDMVWHHPDIFSIAGVFSGSLWWRTKSLEDNYNEETDRIMHQLIRHGKYKPGLRFFFTTGSLDETADRNNNGIIDSIDDTLALIDELVQLGYYKDYDIKYINYDDGKHDIQTWGRAFPHFLLWSFNLLSKTS